MSSKGGLIAMKCFICHNDTLTEEGGDCGDDDPACECDAFYKCSYCQKWFVVPCPAHAGFTWEGMQTMSSYPESTQPDQAARSKATP